MHLKDVNENLEHRITGGSLFQWNCYGQNARFLDYESDFAVSSCVFDTVTLEIYEVTIESKKENSRPYRWLNPNTKQLMLEETAYRNMDLGSSATFDDTKFIDLETEEDYLQKSHAIFNGQPFDERVTVPLELADEELFAMMKLAHQKDITLNQLIAELLQVAIDNEHKESNE